MIVHMVVNAVVQAEGQRGHEVFVPGIFRQSGAEQFCGFFGIGGVCLFDEFTDGFLHPDGIDFKEVVGRHVKEIGELFDDGIVGGSRSVFPAADRLRSQPEGFREVFLCHIASAAEVFEYGGE